jgi:hypothetical protein
VIRCLRRQITNVWEIITATRATGCEIIREAELRIRVIIRNTKIMQKVVYKILTLGVKDRRLFFLLSLSDESYFGLQDQSFK